LFLVSILSFGQKYSNFNNRYIENLTIEKLVLKFSEDELGRLGTALNLEIIDGIYKMFVFC
jgi:hypothetical protein